MTGGPRPLHKQRSEWTQFEHFTEIDGVPTRWLRRRVNDGELTACVADEPQGWHLSISFRNHRGEYSRYPSWDEISHARYELLPNDIDVAMFLPPPEQYVALHDSTFHLHQHPERNH